MLTLTDVFEYCYVCFILNICEYWKVDCIKFHRAPEIDISELESLFSANTDASGGGKVGVRRGTNVKKPEKVQLVSGIDLLRVF